MNAKPSKVISNSFLLPVKRPRFFALLAVFCILLNSFCPRAVLELKNYDVVVLAMGSQSVFLHLFALPNKVAIDLANLLYNNKTHPSHNQSNRENRARNTSNSSSDFTILTLDEQQNLKNFQADACGCGALIRQAVKEFLPGYFLAGPAVFQGILYCIFIMLFWSRPRGGIVKASINLIINSLKPGLNLRPGFLFAEARHELAN